MKRTILWAGITLALLMPACQNSAGDDIEAVTRAAGGGSGVGYVLPYSPYDYEVLESKFTAAAITVDGNFDEGIWAQAAASQIRNFKDPVNAANATAGATGTVKSVWDGYTLYIAVDVTDATPANLTILENNGTGGTYTDPTVTPKSNGAYAIMEAMDWSTYQTPPYNGKFDNVEFAVDFWNDKQDKWADDDGLFAISRSGKLVYDSSGGFGDEGTYASVFASPDAREYNDRIKAYAVTEKAGGAGYTVELALQIYGAKPANGTAFGVDVMISDAPANDTARTSRTYWSHKDNSYRFSSRDGNQDWGAIVLTGHDGQAALVKSDWMLANAIRWVDANLPGTQGYAGTGTSVAANWSTATWTALSNAVKTGRDLLTEDGGKHVAASVSQADIKDKAQAIEGAIASLVAADDPLGATAMSAPITNTLPDPLVFKTKLIAGKNPGDVVANAADWAKRVEEIRLLASIYEYGPKPGAPSSVTVTRVTGAPGFGPHWEPAPWYYPNRPPMQVSSSPASYAVETTITYAGTEASVPEGVNPVAGSTNIAFNVYKPGGTGKAPVIINFDGNQTEFTDNGIAVVAVPNGVTSDDRATPWNPVRAGTFRQFYPYGARGQRYEISNEMGAAWGASRAIDALVAAKDIPITSKTLSISITGGATTANTFTLKDRINFDEPGTDGKGNVTYGPWWQVGKLEGADTVSVQQGSGKAVMLYLASGSSVPSQSAGTYTLDSTIIQHQNEQGVWTDVTDRGTVSVTLVVGAEQALSEKLGDFLDEEEIAVTGYSINGKYAFTAALYDERIKVAIPGAAGASGPQTWRYNPASTVYTWGKGNVAGGELIGDHVMKNPGRSTEIFRRFLTHFNYYERLRGIDANGDFSYGYAQRLPYDGHELVASLFPRAVIERAVINDFNDGSEQDAIAFQGARIVYRKLVDLELPAATPGGTAINKAGIDDLVVFNYHAWATSGDPHGAVSWQQRANESLYMGWYFNGGVTPTYLTATELYPWNQDPFFNDVLVAGGSNSYERHYGGFPVMMPWPWAGPYYPAKQ
ncbi:MAG: hypothetical protein LBS57_13725 [Treponema sp.]|jgi:hypothetical protein|nr:hypothetical protein [Treponema sp.]